MLNTLYKPNLYHCISSASLCLDWDIAQLQAICILLDKKILLQRIYLDANQCIVTYVQIIKRKLFFNQDWFLRLSEVKSRITSSVEVENQWNHTYTPVRAFMVVYRKIFAIY